MLSKAILSLIVVVHSSEPIDSLDETLFSLATQDYESLEVIVVTDWQTEAETTKIEKILHSQPWAAASVAKSLSVNCSGTPDRRAQLITEGIGAATGQYLAFLSVGDKVYQQGYIELLAELEGSNFGAAVGGIRIASYKNLDGKQQVASKALLTQNIKNKFSAFIAEFLPLSSFIVDRSRVSVNCLQPAGLRRLEGKWLLIQLAELAPISWKLTDAPIGEIANQEGVTAVDFREWKVQPDEDSSISPEDRLDKLLATKQYLGSILELKNWLQESSENLWTRLRFDLMKDNQAVDVSVVLRLIDHASEKERSLFQTKFFELQRRQTADLQSNQKSISELKLKLKSSQEEIEKLRLEKCDVEAQIAGWKQSNEQLGSQLDRQSAELNRKTYKIARKLGSNIHALKSIIRGS